jgi:predicted small metal-binding protein
MHGSGGAVTRCARRHLKGSDAFTRSMRMTAPETHTDKYIACASIVPDCPFEATATTEEELLKMVATHAAYDHGVTEVTPELVAKVKAAIQHR